METVADAVRTRPFEEPGEDRTRSVLSFIHGLLLAPGEAPAPVPRLLAELAAAFGAAGAGLAMPPAGPVAFQLHVDAGGRPVTRGRCPWDARPEVLERAGGAATAVGVPGEDGT